MNPTVASDVSTAPAIRAFDYLRGYELFESEILAAVQRVLRSGQLILGPEGQAFEQEFARFAGTSHAVSVGSGTDALILALMALDIGPQDEVITVANTAVPTASAIRAVGAIPRFVDVDPATLLMDANAVESRITPATRCLIPVHLYGLPVPPEPLLTLAQKYQLKIVEDCAHAHGARHQNQPVGTWGDVGCFSFYPTKILGAFGDGGLCLTSDPAIAARLQSLRMYGYRDQRIAEEDGRNSRLDEVQAAILRLQLKRLNTAIARRREIADFYIRGLSAAPEFPASGWILPAAGHDSEHVWHQFVIRVPNRPRVMQTLQEQNIGFGIHYETPLHHMPAFAAYHGPEKLPVTERAATEILSLPMYPELTDQEIQRVIVVLQKAMCG